MKKWMAFLFAAMLLVMAAPSRADIGRLSYQALIHTPEGTDLLGRREADAEGRVYPFTGDRHGKRDATVMIYLCGSNLEAPDQKGARGGGATRDLREIVKSGYDQDRITVLVMAGGATKWYNEAISASETGIYEVVGNSLVKRWGNGLRDMGQAETLRDFVNFGYEHYPASSYGLVIWDHAGGPVMELVDDFVSGNAMASVLTVSEALSQTPAADKKLQWIGFDACLMGSIEVAKVMARYADYMIASEECEPNCGWNYSFLKGLEADANVRETGQRIVDTCMEQYPNDYRDERVTLACYDLGRVDALEKTVDDFFSELNRSVNGESFPQIAALRQKLEPIYLPETELVDIRLLVDTFKAYSPEKARKLLENIEETIVCESHNAGAVSGLSTYFPYYQPRKYLERYSAIYSTLGYAENYVNYLGLLNRAQMGPPLTGWKNLGETLAVRDTRSRFSIQLTAEQIELLAERRLVMLQECEDASGKTGYVIVDPEGLTELDGHTLSGEYTHWALFPVDPEGKPLLEYPLSWTKDAAGHRLISARLLSGESALDVQLVCGEGPANELQIQSIRAWDERAGYYSDRYDVNPGDYDTISFAVPVLYKTRDAEGILKGVGDWNTADEKDWPTCSMPVEGDWTLRILTDAIDENALCAAFTLTDCQRNTHTNELIYVVARGEADEDFVLNYDNDDVRISSNHLLENNGGYYLLMSFENRGSEEVYYHIRNVVIGGTPLDTDYWIEGDDLGIPPGELGEGVITIDDPGLLAAGSSIALSFDFETVSLDDEVLATTRVTGHLNPSDGSDGDETGKSAYHGEISAMAEDGTLVNFEYDSTPPAAKALETQRTLVETDGAEACFGESYADIKAVCNGELFGLMPVSIEGYEPSMGEVNAFIFDGFERLNEGQAIAVAMGIRENDGVHWQICEGNAYNGALELQLSADLTQSIAMWGGLLAVFT